MSKMVDRERASQTSTVSSVSGTSSTSFSPEPVGFVRINLLTTHASSRAKCDLCENVGSLMCKKCRVTYYCTLEHCKMDQAFHACICSRISGVRQPIPFHPLSETRERLRNQKRSLMRDIYQYAFDKGQCDLEQSCYDSAIPSAIVSYTYANELYGQSDEVIPPLLIAAESFVHKGNLRLADGFLARALFVELVKPNIRPCVRARINRVEGLIALAKGMLKGALASFSEEIYQNTEEYGPEHIKTCAGYCSMAHVFHVMGQYSISSSLFRQSVQIWIDYLEPIMEDITDETKITQIATVKVEKVVWIPDREKSEAERILMCSYLEQLDCYKRESQDDYVTHLDMTKTCYALSILNFICERYSEAQTRVLEAHIYIDKGELHKLPIALKLQTIFKISSRKSYQQDKKSHFVQTPDNGGMES